METVVQESWVPRSGVQWSPFVCSGRGEGTTVQPHSHRFNTIRRECKHPVDKEGGNTEIVMENREIYKEYSDILESL